MRQKGSCCLTGSPHAAQRLALRALTKEEFMYLHEPMIEVMFIDYNEFITTSEESWCGDDCLNDVGCNREELNPDI